MRFPHEPPEARKWSRMRTGDLRVGQRDGYDAQTANVWNGDRWVPERMVTPGREESHLSGYGTTKLSGGVDDASNRSRVVSPCIGDLSDPGVVERTRWYTSSAGTRVVMRS